MLPDKLPTTKEEYRNLLKNMFKVASEKGIRTEITYGNCGSFAIALKHIFKTGKLIHPDHPSHPFAHVLLMNEKLLYDGVGVYEFDEFLKNPKWKKYFKSGWIIEDEKHHPIEKEVPERTRYPLPYDIFEGLLLEAFNTGKLRKFLKPREPLKVKECPKCSFETYDKEIDRCTACGYSKWYNNENENQNQNENFRNCSEKCPICHEKSLKYNYNNDFYFCTQCDFEANNLGEYNTS